MAEQYYMLIEMEPTGHWEAHGPFEHFECAMAAGKLLSLVSTLRTHSFMALGPFDTDQSDKEVGDLVASMIHLILDPTAGHA